MQTGAIDERAIARDITHESTAIEPCLPGRYTTSEVAIRRTDFTLAAARRRSMAWSSEMWCNRPQSMIRVGAMRSMTARSTMPTSNSKFCRPRCAASLRANSMATGSVSKP